LSAQQRLEGPDLEELLAKVRSDFGQAATIIEANKLRKGGVGGFFAKESYEVVVDVDGDVVGPSFGDDDEDEPFVPFTLDDLVGRVDDPAPDFTGTLAAALADPPAPAPIPTVDLEPAWPAQEAIEEVAPVVAATPKVARLVAGGLDGVAERRLPARAAAPVAPAPSADQQALATLGMPAHLLALPTRTDEPAAVSLVRLLAALPAAPPLPRTSGSVVCVVADKATGLQLAEQLGHEGEVVVASRKRGGEIRTVEDADERRRAWRRRRTPTLVVVDSPFGIAGDPWAADVLDAFEPVLVVGHVDAARKPEDVRAWAEGLGGLDAIALDGLAGTTTPAAVLGVGLPVALLEGETATPARWAAALTDRLAALAA
jgi:hypothetical protein